MKAAFWCCLALFKLLFLSGLSANAQDRYYDIVVKGKSIGEMHVIKNKVADLDVYEINSKIRVSLLFGLSIDFDLINKWKDGGLVYAYSRNVINDNEKFEVVIEPEGQRLIHYQVGEKEEKKYLNLSGNYLTVTQLYFEEPKGYSQVFSEREGEFLSLKKLKEGVHELSMIDGKKNWFFYENGQCVKVEVEYSFVNFSFELRE